MKSKPLKCKQKIELPYWPSAEFMRKSIGMLREKGSQGTDAQLESMIKEAYWQKRAQLLADEAMKKYEEN